MTHRFIFIMDEALEINRHNAMALYMALCMAFYEVKPTATLNRRT